jgi:hypothetical protein
MHESQGFNLIKLNRQVLISEKNHSLNLAKSPFNTLINSVYPKAESAAS